MGAYEDRPKLLWSLTGSGLSTTISGAGNSGNWAVPAAPGDAYTPVTFDPASDFQLMVYVNGKTLTPTFSVGLGYYDDQGHLFAPTSLLLSVPVTSVPTTAALNAGVRAGSGGSTYFAFPRWGQVYWTLTGGGTVTGVEINLWGK